MAEYGFTSGKDIYDLKDILKRLSDLEAKSSNIKEIYPVGSIYMSVRNVNPSGFFGGTWVAWGQGRVPIGIGSNGTTNYSAPEGTGGSESVSIRPTGSISATALTIRQTPPHQHRIWGVNRNVNVQGGGSDPGYNALYTGNMHSVPKDALIAWSEQPYSNVQPDGTVSEKDRAVGEAHSHGITLNQVTANVRQPYITCYMWKRTA